MTTAETARIEPANGLPWLLLGGIWPFLLLWDWATRADLAARLWTMPLPVAGLLLGLCVLGYLTARGSVSRKHPGRWPVLLTFTGAATAVTITALNGHDPLFGLIKLAELALVAGATVSLATLFDHGRSDPTLCMQAMIAGTAVSVLVFAALHVTGRLDHLSRLAMPGFIHIRIFGFTLALMIAASAGLWVARADHSRILVALSLVILWTALFWSGGRGALLSVIVGTLAIAAVLPVLRPAILPLVATGIAGFLIALFLPGEGAELGLAGRMEIPTTLGSADALSSGRLEMWRAAWAAALEHPWAGHGYAQARWMYLDAGFNPAHLHTHSIVFDAALAFGLPLAALLAAAVLTSWGRGLAKARASGAPLAAAGCTMVTVFLFHALLDGIYFYAQGLVPLALGTALILARPAEPACRS